MKIDSIMPITTSTSNNQFIISADWLIPMTRSIQRQLSNGSVNDDGITDDWLTDHCIVIEQRKIIDIIPQRKIAELYPNIEHIELKGFALLPGFINAHCHAAMSLLRGFSDDLSLMQWLKQDIWPIEAQFVDNEFVFQGTQLAVAEMLKSGTSCYQDMYFMPDQQIKVVQQTGIRANIGFMVVDSQTVWARDSEECIEKATDLLDQYKHLSNLTFSFAPHAPYSVTEDTLKRLNSLSFELNINIQMHIHETNQEITEFTQKNGMRPLEKLDEIGLLGPQLNAVHMTQLNTQEIQRLAITQSHVIHCPQSNMKLASGICPITRLIESGVNVAIGTDGAASNNDLDMLAELQSAAFLAKSSTHDPSSMNAYQALYSATMGGAKALAIEHLVGSLEIGKEADIVAIDLNQIETQPVYSPISQIVYAASREQIKHLWVAGKQLLDNRKLTTLNEQSILQNTKAWGEKIRGFKK